MAERIQLRRTKGWRKPEGAIVVARPSRWGNPYRLNAPGGEVVLGPDVEDWVPTGHNQAVAVMLWLYEEWITDQLGEGTLDLADLHGKDLACWCPLDGPCHADVLLRLAKASAKALP